MSRYRRMVINTVVIYGVVYLISDRSYYDLLVDIQCIKYSYSFNTNLPPGDK